MSKIIEILMQLENQVLSCFPFIFQKTHTIVINRKLQKQNSNYINNILLYEYFLIVPVAIQ